MEDLFNIFLIIPPACMPTFLAKDLSNLPPVDISNFDLSSILKVMTKIKEHLKLLQEEQQLTDAAQASFCVTKTETKRKKTTPASKDTSNQNGSDVVSTSESEANRHHINVEARNTELADLTEDTIIEEIEPEAIVSDSNEESDDNDVLRLA